MENQDLLVLMASQVSWPPDLPAGSLESGNLGIWKSRNLKIPESENQKIWNQKKRRIIKIRMFAGPAKNVRRVLMSRTKKRLTLLGAIFDSFFFFRHRHSSEDYAASHVRTKTWANEILRRDTHVTRHPLPCAPGAS